MDLRTRTKIRWITFYSADLPHKSLSNKDLLIINGGLLDPSKIQHALLLEKSDGFFGSLMFKNPSEILFCKIRRKIQHALLLENPAFFLFPYARDSVEKLVLQTSSFFVSNVRWKWCTTWIKRFHFFQWTKGCTNWVLNPGNKMTLHPDLSGSRTLAGRHQQFKKHPITQSHSTSRQSTHRSCSQHQCTGAVAAIRCCKHFELNHYINHCLLMFSSKIFLVISGRF